MSVRIKAICLSSRNCLFCGQYSHRLQPLCMLSDMRWAMIFTAAISPFRPAERSLWAGGRWVHDWHDGRMLGGGLSTTLVFLSRTDLSLSDLYSASHCPAAGAPMRPDCRGAILVLLRQSQRLLSLRRLMRRRMARGSVTPPPPPSAQQK